MELYEVLKLRRSIRKFKPDPISEEAVKELLEAARLAPSGLNLQPWRYVVVRNPDARESIAKATPSSFIAEAPIIMVCCMDAQAFLSYGTRVKELIESGAFLNTGLKELESEDFLEKKALDETAVKAMLSYYTAISIEHIVLRAADMGLGTCWIGAFDAEEIKRIIGLDGRYAILALLPVGRPGQMPSPRPRLSIDEILLKEI